METKVWKYITAAFIAVVVSITANCQTTKILMNNMVANGATPQEAACALNHYNETNDVMCLEVARLGDSGDRQ